MREFFVDLDEAEPDLGGVHRSKPKSISVTDPAAAVTSKDGKLRYAYGLNATIDTASGVVLDVEAAPARTADEPAADEPAAARRMVERTKERHGRVPDVLAADSAYGSRHFLAWAEGHGIEPHVPEPHVPLTSTRLGTGKLLAKDAFAYDEKRDLYVCPEGKLIERQADRAVPVQEGHWS